MPTIRILPNGSSGAVPGYNASPAKRGEACGYSVGVSRRLRELLYATRFDLLAGLVFSFSLTYGRALALPSAAVVKLHVQALARFARRTLGVSAFHWLIEFQRDGFPHLHGIAVHESDVLTGRKLVSAWLKITASNGSLRYGQHWARVDNAVGWAMYLAKHASRSAAHYQRLELPPSWRGKSSGRMFGFSSGWPFSLGYVNKDVPVYLYVEFKRQARKYVYAEVRATRPQWKGFQGSEADFWIAGWKWRKRLAVARRVAVRLARGERESKEKFVRRHRTRGFSEWLPSSVAVKLAMSLGIPLVDLSDGGVIVPRNGGSY